MVLNKIVSTIWQTQCLIEGLRSLWIKKTVAPVSNSMNRIKFAIRNMVNCLSNQDFSKSKHWKFRSKHLWIYRTVDEYSLYMHSIEISVHRHRLLHAANNATNQTAFVFLIFHDNSFNTVFWVGFLEWLEYQFIVLRRHHILCAVEGKTEFICTLTILAELNMYCAQSELIYSANQVHAGNIKCVHVEREIPFGNGQEALCVDSSGNGYIACGFRDGSIEVVLLHEIRFLDSRHDADWDQQQLSL